MNAQSRFMQNLETVSFVHVVLVVALILTPFLHRMFRKKPEVIIPVEFCVEVPSESIPDSLAKVLEQSREDDIPVPKPEKKSPPKKVTPPKPKPTPKKVEKSTHRVRIDNPRARNTTRTLSPDEVRRLLAEGAKPSDHTSIPSEDVRCMELIRQALYDAWSQPSFAEVGNAVAEIEVRLQKDGAIFGVRLTGKSGNAILDSSAMQAATSVRRIGGLTPDFLAKYEDVTVAFKVQPE